MSHRATREVSKRYRAALRKYIEANASLEGLSGREFAEAYQRAEEARAEFERVREEMLDCGARVDAAELKRGG